MRTAFVLLLSVVFVAGGAAYYVRNNNHVETKSFRTTPVKRGDLTTTIIASGTLQPEDVIDVGAQITGKILSFGPDETRPDKTVDFCSNVRKGQLLANIDPTYYQAKVDQCRAALKKAEAELLQMKANCKQAKNEWERAKELKPLKAIADSDYDAAEAAYQVAEANIAVGEAGVRQAQAALDMAEVDLGYTEIRSPIDGEIIKRRVNIGQTVTSGLNTPSIFLIAKDLRRMEIWVLVNEMDIGRMKLGVPVSFKVDAYPNDTFSGVVSEIRKDASMTSNVVSYTVVVTTENPDLKLFPYMTANVRFEIERKNDVLMVANAALKWEPKTSQIAGEPEGVTADSRDKNGGGRLAPAQSPGKANVQRIWLADGDKVRPLEVVIGITDDVCTEISGEGVKEGMKIVVGETEAKTEDAASDEMSVPFLPKRPKGSRPSPPPG